MNLTIFFFSLLSFILPDNPAPRSWIRINALGYPPEGIKVAIWCSKSDLGLSSFEIVDVATGKAVYKNSAGKTFGSYGPFSQTYRLNFSAFRTPGKYFVSVNEIHSPVFTIGKEVYKGTADFILNYMRQQRSGYNPFLKDSCHTHDGYTLYGPMPDSTHINVSGGWHDASDYLQYSTTSANATYHLLMAYRDFPKVFSDNYSANGLPGKNDRADVLDEAHWGLDWLLKMHPREDWMFNQLADDRDHINMRIPKEDNQYGRGYERPVYFITGEPQQRGKFLNNTTGTSSTAGKFSSAFALGSRVFENDQAYSNLLKVKAFSAYSFGKRKPGVSQTVSVRSPYIYAEGNWTDDMELAAVNLFTLSDNKNGYLNEALQLAGQEPITPWLGKDTASHYQWYPFINIGHAELAEKLKGAEKEIVLKYYRDGIDKVWQKANGNAFYRGIPFIWCSNNLTVAFTIQCYWYRMLSEDNKFSELEQSNLDWIFGCNPWGTSMVYGLPSGADTPVDPHSAFTHLKKYPINGGLIDGPVFTKIFKSLIGLQLTHEDAYADFQSDLAVYHDDYGDYSTNEPTMDGTASLIYLMAAKETDFSLQKANSKKQLYNHGAVIRGDTTKKKIALVFTGDSFGDGGETIRKALKSRGVKASFFLTGNFYRSPAFTRLIQSLKADGHYLGAHSDKHLLYCDWNDRDSLLITREEFSDDLLANYSAMKDFEISSSDAPYFLPPYEWYNETIATWTSELNLQLINYTPGTLSHADYTTPGMSSYRSSDKIFQSITSKEAKSGLNGFILLMHVGTDPTRKDKLYTKLDMLMGKLQAKNYRMVKIDELLGKREVNSEK